MRFMVIIIALIFIVIFIFFYFISKKESGKNNLNINKQNMKILSPSFNDGDFISKKYTCDEDDINPSLNINNVPENTKSLVLIMDDPDAVSGLWTHWLVWNINPEIKVIEENSRINGIYGKNDSGELKYGGPCPPSGTHRYFFRVYALDTMLNLNEGVGRKVLDNAMKTHIISSAVLMGKYSR